MEITNDLICSIERLYRAEYGRRDRLRMLNMAAIKSTMRKYYLGLQCDYCLGRRYCCEEHRRYFWSIRDLLDWAWIRNHFFSQAQVCAICGGRIEPSDTWGSGLSLDHKVPISKGGLEFDRTNMQPAHFSCNSRKGARQV